MKCLLCNGKLLSDPRFFKLFCGRNIEQHQICEQCLMRFHLIGDKHCQYCYQQGEFRDDICEDCFFWKVRQKEFVQHTAWYTYNQEMHDFFRRYKRKGDVELAKVFSYEIAESKFFEQFDLITYIPMSDLHEEEREFNPVQELFKQLPLQETMRVFRDTGAQAMKNRRERLAAPQKFKLITEIDPEQKILIVDDIYTTGRTLNHARQCILEQYPEADVQTFSLVR